MIPDTTPILVGVGQCVDSIQSGTYEASSPADLAARAAALAMEDAMSRMDLSGCVDAIGTLRTFEDSSPRPAPFGKPDKFPLAVSKRLGISPKVAVLEKAGGHTPLTLMCRFADQIAAGELNMAIVAGAESISTQRYLMDRGESRDWAETLEGEVENTGSGSAEYVTRYNVKHGLRIAPTAYGLIENARRAHLGISKQEYRNQMGQLFSSFSSIAANNPFSAHPTKPLTPAEIVDVGEHNRMIAGPYMRRLVSRDQVNQSAALLLSSVRCAREAGIPENRWIYIHAAALSTDRDIIERAHLGKDSAASAALKMAMSIAKKSVSEIDMFDFYSCFPIAVFAAAIDALGLKPDDDRALTVTGGMPFFGGPGNNYSTHAIAEMTSRLRKSDVRKFGLVGLNGGYLTKYGALVLSNKECQWRPLIQSRLEDESQVDPALPVAIDADGVGTIETYSVSYNKGTADSVLIIGRLNDGRRFLANEFDQSLTNSFLEGDPIGETIYVKSTPSGNKFAFHRRSLEKAFPTHKPRFEADYKHVSITREGRILEVTMNRPDVRNALDAEAHYELASIFDAFEADNDLWVAIITGAGDKAFCAGADLRRLSSGGTRSMPKSGFAGITSRRNKKPIIAAVNGIAFGGGFEVCLACNLVVADETARFALPEVRRGVIAGAGGAMRLHRHLPRNVAMDLLLTGREMEAPEALSYGFVNRLSKPGRVLDTARGLAREIASVSPTSVRLTLQVLSEADQYSSPEDASIELQNSKVFDELMLSEDLAEGLAAFIEKRTPIWTNR